MSGQTPQATNAIGNSGGWGQERLSQIPKYKQQIVELIASGLFLSEICQQLSITPNTVRNWRAADKSFDEAYTDAESEVDDGLEKEAMRRAKNGVLEPVVSKGQLVIDQNGEPLMMRRYSDGLLMFLLKGRRAKIYGDKREITAQVGVDVVGAKSTLESKFAAAVAAATSSGD